MVTPEIIDEFCNYWTESNPKGRMRFELQKVFDIKRRLATWTKNNKEWNIKPKSKYQYEDFQFDTTGYNKIGYCSKCSKSDFYKKPHYEDSRCCGSSLKPKREEE